LSGYFTDHYIAHTKGASRGILEQYCGSRVLSFLVDQELLSMPPLS